MACATSRNASGFRLSCILPSSAQEGTGECEAGRRHFLGCTVLSAVVVGSCAKQSSRTTWTFSDRNIAPTGAVHFVVDRGRAQAMRAIALRCLSGLRIGAAMCCWWRTHLLLCACLPSDPDARFKWYILCRSSSVGNVFKHFEFHVNHRLGASMSSQRQQHEQRVLPPCPPG